MPEVALLHMRGKACNIDKLLPLLSSVFRARHEEGYAVIFEGLFERIMTLQQQVPILSCDTPTKAAISPLLPLNGCDTIAEKVFRGMKIKMASQVLNSIAWANAAQGSYLELHGPKHS